MKSMQNSKTQRGVLGRFGEAGFPAMGLWILSGGPNLQSSEKIVFGRIKDMIRPEHSSIGRMLA
jgi:hypothetical protein